MTTVLAAIIEKDGRILICQRSAAQPHPLKWEFPGGKLEPGESPDAALKRELEEELGIEVATATEIIRYEYAYPEKKPILLVFYSVRQFAGAPVNRVFQEIRWETPDRLPDYDFLEGDVEFVRARFRSPV